MKRRYLLLFAVALACVLGVKVVSGWDTSDAVRTGSASGPDEGLVDPPALPEEVAQGELQKPGLGPRREALDPAPLQEIGSDGGATASTSVTALVRGRVLDTGGNGVPGARVLLTNQYNPPVPLEAVDELGRSPFPLVSATTDENGEFWVRDGLEPQRGVSVVVLAGDDQPYRLKGEWLYPDQTLDLGELRLRPGATLTGQVVDADGNGLSARLARRARVDDRNSAWGDAPVGWGAGMLEFGASGEDGRFELHGLAPGPMTLLALMDGYLPGEVSVEGVNGAFESVRIQLERGAQIRGELVGAPEDEAGLRVWARPLAEDPLALPRTAPLEDGGFEFGGLIPGRTYEVGVVRSPEGGWFVPEVSAVKAVALSSDPPDVALRWQRIEGLSLQLVDAVTDESIERVEVFLSAEGMGTGRLEGGFYPGGRLHLDGEQLPRDRGAELKLLAPGYLDRALALGDAREQGVEGVTTLRLEPGPRLDVRVLDLAGVPVADAELLLGTEGKQRLDRRSETAHLQERSWRTRRALTRGDGRAVLSALQTSKGRPRGGLLAVFADGYAPAWIDVAADATSADVTLTRGGTLVIRAVDDEAHQLDDVIVELQRFDGSAWPMKASSTVGGKVTFEHLVPGTFRYRSRVESNSWRPPGYSGEASWVSVDVGDGETVEAVLECGGFYNLEGTIADRNGPMADAQMVLLPGNRTRGEDRWDDFHSGRGSRFHVQSRADGLFRFYVINEGRYTLLVEHEGLTVAARILVEVKRNAEPLSLYLPSTAVEGTVSFSDGSPAAGAYVSVKVVDGPAQGSTETDELGRFAITGVPDGRALEIRAGGRFVDHEPEPMTPLLAEEVRRVELVGEARGAVRFTVVGQKPKRFTVQGERQDGEQKAVMVQPDDSGRVKETSHCVPGPWVFQIEVTRPDGTSVRLERRVEVVRSEISEVEIELE